MSWKHYSVLACLSLILVGSVSFVQIAPGYMDAEYYYAMGLRIANFDSLAEPFLWNYLNGYFELNQPAFLFWMPLPAFVAALGMVFTGWKSFTGAKIGFLAASALVPSLTMKLTFALSGKKHSAFLAGALSLFSVFYIPFLGISDSFGILMILGGSFFLLARKLNRYWEATLLGVVVGLIHLTRADGIIWLAVAGLAAALKPDKKIRSMTMIIIGYLCIMAPWFARNMYTIGEIFPAGSSRMFWLTEYNDLFTFEPGELTFTNWIRQGFAGIARNILWAFSENWKTALFVQGEIILVPLIGLGFLKTREDIGVRAVITAWILIFIVMTVIFPFAGARGGLFHSGAATQPLFWALAVIGLGEFIDWGTKRRGWKKIQAERVMGFGMLLMVFSMTVFVVIDRVFGDVYEQPQWNSSYIATIAIDNELSLIGVPRDSVIMINNPPGLYIASERPAVVIPNGGIDILQKSAEVLGADYLVLESNHPAKLNDLYKRPRTQDTLEYLKTISGVHYFKFQRPAE
jgi:hypothetical protein